MTNVAATLAASQKDEIHLKNNLVWRAVPQSVFRAVDTSKGPNFRYVPGQHQAYFQHDFNYNFHTIHADRNELIFCTDLDICYQAFAQDFGPLNLTVLYRYCKQMQKLLKSEAASMGTSPTGRTIVHLTNGSETMRRTNSAWIIAAYCVVCEGMTAEEAYRPFEQNTWIEQSFRTYRDASSCHSLYEITILDCLQALEAAIKLDWFNLKWFCPEFYEHYEKVENGDLNWIIPHKFLAFATPSARQRDADGFFCWTPENYVHLYRKWNIKTVVRLNKQNTYDRTKFLQHGIHHEDLYFNDGSTPSNDIVDRFLKLVEAKFALNSGKTAPNQTEGGAVAVHCKAGLGRTGTLIGLWCMKHHKMPARMFIAWNRLTRPGSILGPQQQYLVSHEAKMFSFPTQVRGAKLTTTTPKGERHLVIGWKLIPLEDAETGSIKDEDKSNSNNNSQSQEGLFAKARKWSFGGRSSFGSNPPQELSGGIFSSNPMDEVAAKYGDDPHALYGLGKMDHEIFNIAKRAPAAGARPSTGDRKPSYGGSIFGTNTSVHTPGAFTKDGQAGQGEWLLQQKRQHANSTRK